MLFRSGLGRGGVICFRNLDKPSKYLSSEFAAIAIDELTLNDQSVFDFRRMRLRWEMTGYLYGDSLQLS